MGFPGVAALLPVGGAALTIWGARAEGVVGRVLAFRPVVFVGLISYSLYLWHWPVIVMQRNEWLLYTGSSRLIEKVIVLGVSLALAVISWRFVEQPFRRRAFSRKALFAGAATAVALVAASTWALAAADGLPSFLPDRSKGFSRYLGYDGEGLLRFRHCMIDEDPRFPLQAQCLSERADRKNVLLVGDSHAAHLWSGMQAEFPELNLLQATGSSCRPTLEAQAKGYPTCRALLRSAFDRARHDPNLAAVVLAGDWDAGESQSAIATAAALRKDGVNAVVIGPSPNYTRPLPRLLTLAARTHDAGVPDRFIDPQSFAVDKAMAEAAQRAGVPYISPVSMLCHGASCITLVGGVPIKWDSNHYTAEGSRYFAHALREGGFLTLTDTARPAP
jgi:hypothetical protein